MSTVTVTGQMLVICVLILVGAYLYRRKYLADDTVQQISWLIVHVTNPAITLSSAIADENAIPVKDIAAAFAISLASYALAALAGVLIALLLRADGVSRIAIVMMTMFANVGFIGIPLTLATLGTEAMFYVSINNLVYTLLFYTIGFSLLKRAAKQEKGSSEAPEERRRPAEILASVFNVGTIAALIAVVIYIFRPQVPMLLSDPLLYAGRCTTFLSMLVLGVSVAGSPLKELVQDKKTWGFVLLRGVVMPLAVYFLLSPWIRTPLMMQVVLLMLAVPSGSLPMIVSRQMGMDDRPFSRGIILSTLLSPITISLVMAVRTVIFPIH